MGASSKGWRPLPSRKEALKAWAKATASAPPPSALRSELLALATSPEGQLAVRARFARTLASLSMISYVCGIGDRHLENFLVAEQDGAMVAIDFGHAFDTATWLLPCPELVPFRLSRQLTAVMDPLGRQAILDDAMVHALRVLRKGSPTLLNVMDVFVKEPLIEWTRRKIERKAADADAAVADAASELQGLNVASQESIKHHTCTRLDATMRVGITAVCAAAGDAPRCTVCARQPRLRAAQAARREPCRYHAGHGLRGSGAERVA